MRKAFDKTTFKKTWLVITLLITTLVFPKVVTKANTDNTLDWKDYILIEIVVLVLWCALGIGLKLVYIISSDIAFTYSKIKKADNIKEFIFGEYEGYKTIEYNNRKYIEFAKFDSNFKNEYIRRYLGYINSDTDGIDTGKHRKVFLLREEKKDDTNLDNNFLLEYDDTFGYHDLKRTGIVWRAIDTKGKDGYEDDDEPFFIPSFYLKNIDNSFWQDKIPPLPYYLDKYKK